VPRTPAEQSAGGPRDWSTTQEVDCSKQDAQRHAGLTRFARLLQQRGALREHLTPERAADIIVTLGSFATYDSLVATRGWTHDQYETWLTDTLQHCLLS
jgi:hypothetical protein